MWCVVCVRVCVCVCVCVCVWNEKHAGDSRRVVLDIVLDTLIPLPFTKQSVWLLPTVPGSFKTNEISFFLSFFHAMADTQSLHLYFNLRHSS